jgi:aconitase A
VVRRGDGHGDNAHQRRCRNLATGRRPPDRDGGANVGEGSSREHAALEPRYRGCVALIARSFARIHETNLKKQGILPLTFVDPDGYDQFLDDDVVSITQLASLEPHSLVNCSLRRATDEVHFFTCAHTMNEEQISWFRAGSALNVIRARVYDERASSAIDADRSLGQPPTPNA